jgi:hypothetical protein
MKRSLIPAVLIAAVVALSACASAKEKVSSAASAVQDAATSAGCTAISSATDALKPYETVSADQVGELKDKVETAISTLGSKLPGDVGTKVTDASKQLDEAVSEADTDPQAAADKASAAVKSLNEQLATASTKLGC